MGPTVALFVAWTVGVISPGPDLVCVLHRSLRGRAQGVGAALGVVTGIAIWIVAAFAGLATLLRAVPGLQTGLQVAGGFVLIVLGLRALFGARRAAGADAADRPGPADTTSERGSPTLDRDSLGEPGDPDGARRTASRGDSRAGPAFAAGLATNLSNPKALVFFGALLTPLLDAGAGLGHGVAVMVGMVAVALAWFLSIATLAAGALSSVRLARVERVLAVVAGGLLIAFGAAFSVWAVRA
ncbi:MAG: LysE family translocator [Dermatophilaceae bacterium]